MRFDASKATDSQLLTRFHEGRDQIAFAELVRRHGPMVAATARRVVRSQDDVEEVAQATFFSLARAASTLRKKSAVAGWLHKTAYTCAVELQRANLRWKHKAEGMAEQCRASGSQMGSHTNEPLMGVANAELERILDSELAKLPEKTRVVIVLCELEGLTQKQAAQQLGVSTATVNERIAKGRRTLHNRLVRRGATLTLAGIAGGAASSRCNAMTETFVADLTTKAMLYSTGKSAAQIGVSSNVIETANKVILAMSKAKIMTVLLVAAAIVPIFGVLPKVAGIQRNSAQGGTIFIDKFDDGSLTDGVPVTWTPFQSSDISISADGLIVSSGNGQSYPAAEAKGLNLASTSLRTEFQLHQGEGAVVYIRTKEQEGRRGYAAAVYANGVVSLVYDGTGEIIDQSPTTLDPKQGFLALQFDAIGDTLNLWVWSPSDPRPAQPLLSASDDSGFVGDIAIGALGANAEAVFRFVNVADVPEPCSAALAVVGLILAFAITREHHC